jgi:hypothetical protein
MAVTSVTVLHETLLSPSFPELCSRYQWNADHYCAVVEVEAAEMVFQI